ncbi:MAG: SH3 domain-containing protein [Chloroflexi bacterium]|nr:SH3 domain-containing protein [Chloroflexota bacterium]
MNVREGPSTLYKVVDVLERGTNVPATADNGKSGDEAWYQVELADGVSGWISGNSQYVSVSGASWDRLRTGKWEAPPTPTPLYFVLPGARERYLFDEIVPLLSTPELVSRFMKNNVRWDGSYDPTVCGGNEYDPAWMVYQHGVDDCDGHAILQCYLLERNDWDAYMIGLSVEGPVGHNVCGVNMDGAILVLDNEGWIVGPFNSLAEVAKHYIGKGWMKDGGSLRTMRASQIAQVTTDYTTPKVTDMPWTFHEY